MHDQAIRDFEKACGTIINPSDERRILLEVMLSYMFNIIRKSNAYARAQFIKYSYGEYLDKLGENEQVIRLQAQKATVEVEFNVNLPTGKNMIIPQGTRVTSDGNLFFSTNNDIFVSWQDSTVSSMATATSPGSEHNNLMIGSINTLCDALPYVQSVRNTTISVGGTDLEDDDSYRERIILSQWDKTTAGPVGQYIFLVKSISPEISDVVVETLDNGCVDIYVLLKGGAIPNESMLEKITNALSNDVRPLTDRITVKAPSVKNASVDATYYINADSRENEANIKKNITAALNQYCVWQKSEIGLAVSPDKLRQLVLNAGAVGIDIISPTYQSKSAHTVIQINQKKLKFGGYR